MRAVFVTLAALLGACSTTPAERERRAASDAAAQAALAEELAGLTPGEPTTCLPEPARTPLSSQQFGSTIVYRVSRDLKYRTDTNGECGGRSGSDDIRVTRTPQARVCRGDIVQSFDRGSGFPTGSCALGEFVPYRKS